jgi:molybdopterin converting factor small subunit
MTKMVKVTVEFLSIMQKYSGGKRAIEMEVPAEPLAAVEFIINKLQIPWQDHLEKSTRIFINKELHHVFAEKGKRLEKGDNILFIPISGGG